MTLQKPNVKNLALLLLLVIVLLISGCAQQKPVELKGIEVDNYNGEKLSSVNDFRENSIKGPQSIDANSYRLEITGLVENQKTYTYEQVLSHQKYSKVVTLNCVEGWSVTILWEGVLVRDLISEAKAKPEAKTVIFYAQDGYSTSFPIEYLTNDILMAYKMNNATLPAERGFPFQLVAEDKWGYKWIKWITKIELSGDTNYKGYWEQRGYNNAGDLNKSKYE